MEFKTADEAYLAGYEQGRADERTKAIEDFIVTYIEDEEQYDGCEECQRFDDFCCIKCFGGRYLEQLKEQGNETD